MTAMAHATQDDLYVFSREEFAARRFDYKPGEHAVFGGPTQRGKTTLAFQLLEYCATPELPAYVAVSKPTDRVSLREGQRLGYRRVTDWPASKKLSELWDGPPAGYLVWPKFGDINNDVIVCADVTRKLLEDRYTAGVKNKHGILVMDDTMVKSKILGLDRHMTTILAMSGAMGIGMWTFVQKPTDSGQAPIWSYGASEHVFLTHDPDRRNRDRYNDIGGVDGQFVANVTKNLKPYQFLYIKRTQRFTCIVDGK